MTAIVHYSIATVGGFSSAFLLLQLAMNFGQGAKNAAGIGRRFEAHVWNVIYYLTVLLMLASIIAGGIGLLHLLIQLISAR